MECNKEEAIRAKGIAEKKMESKDFVGARKFAMKADRLYPDLENIRQMICVCDVHCSAESKSFGSEKDWYDILKVGQSADETSINKQYRKLCLLLHPDKNKFAGAETAFMLIKEAQKVLLDKEKRPIFDAKYKRFSQSTSTNPPPQANKNPKNAAKPPSGQTNATPPSGQNNATKNAGSHVKKQPQQQAQPGVSGQGETFWTVCPFCAVRYRYFKYALNKNLVCQSCKKQFIAYDMLAESTTTQTTPQGNATQTSTCAPAGVPNQTSNGRSQGNSGQQPSGGNANQTAASARGVSNQGGGCSASNGRSQGNSGQQKQGVGSSVKSGKNEQVSRSKKTNEPNKGVNKTNKTTFDGSNVGKGEKKEAVESRGSFQSKGSTGSKDTAVRKGGGASGSNGGSSSHQRSSQSKRQAGSVDETLNSSKRLKVNNPPSSSPTRQTSSKVGSANSTKPGFTVEINRSAKEMPNKNDSGKDNDLQKSCKVDKSANGTDKSAVKDDDLQRSPNPRVNKSANGIDKSDVKDNGLQRSCKVDKSANGIDKSAKDKPNENDSVKVNRVVEDVRDSDFNVFDQNREDDHFKVGQIWAIYDTLDAMPRFYAQIRKVSSPGFKLRLSWLEPDPDEEATAVWADKELPFSCGKFKIGASDNTEDRLMFSHLISWQKGHGKGSILIRPKKDETWALFRDWHMDWISNPDNHKEFEYDFVEILSDYDESAGVRVAFLGKVKGFSCLFCRAGRDEIQIPPSEYLRFAHNIPSFRMAGEEREGVPRGSLELDPASIPLNLEEIPLPEEMKSGMATGHSSISDSVLKGGSPGVVVIEDESDCQNEQMSIDEKNQSTSNVVAEHASEAFELPDPEFFDFDGIRKLDVFQVGQVWALYSDADGLPKFYGQIKQVDQDSEVAKLKIAWLEAFSLPNDLKKWRSREMPIGCGKFKIKKRRFQRYFDSSPFSHQVRAETVKSNLFEIYPREGEIWALYKNWNVDMTISDLENCDYDYVEVLEESIKGSQTKVLALDQVPGYNSVFKAKMSGSSLSTMDIPHNELLRFSHQIPSHDLTEEKDGSLRGFKELDPSAFPASFFLPKVR